MDGPLEIDRQGSVPHAPQSHQGDLSRGGSWHPIPAGDQVGPEGDHDPRRPAADPVRHRRGARGRHQGVHLRHVARKECAGGLFRPCTRAGKRPSQEGQARTAGASEIHQHGIRGHRVYPAAQGVGPWSRGLVRAPAPGRRKLCRHTARRRDRRRHAVPAADGGGPLRAWRQHGCRHEGTAREGPCLRHSRHRRGGGRRREEYVAWSRSRPPGPRRRTLR